MIGVLAADRRSPERFAGLVLLDPVAALHRRRGLPRRVQRRRHRRAAGVAGQQLPGLVRGDGAGDHGQPGPAGAGAGADQQLLPHRPADRAGLRAGDVPVRQPRRPGAGHGADAGRRVRARRDRAARRSARTCTRRIPGSRLVTLDATGHCPQLSAPGGHGRGDHGPSSPGRRDVPDRARRRPDPATRLPGRAFSALLEDSVEDLYENAPCGYLSTLLDGTIAKINATLLGWLGLDRRQVVGRAPVRRPAHRGRPALPRDALRAAAADAGRGQRGGAGAAGGRRQPAAGAGHLHGQDGRGRRAAADPHHRRRRPRPPRLRAGAAARPAGGRPRARPPAPAWPRPCSAPCCPPALPAVPGLRGRRALPRRLARRGRRRLLRPVPRSTTAGGACSSATCAARAPAPPS